MGWDGVKLDRGETPESYVRKMIGKGDNIVEMATVNGTIYAATKADTDSEYGLWQSGDVLGLVVLVEKRDGYTMFKFMDEFSGPVASEAPLRILRKLTDIRDGVKCAPMRQFARNWRKRCHDYNVSKH